MPRAPAHFDAEIVPPQPRKCSSHPLYEHIDDNKEQTSDDYFPFKSWTMMELAAWRMYFEVSRPALDALLSIVSDERFSPKEMTCHTAQSLINHSRSNLPTLPMSVTELSLTRRQRVKGQQPAGRKLEMGAVEVPIKVPYIPLVSSIIRLFSDPVRAQLMTTRLEPIDHSTTVCLPLLNSLEDPPLVIAHL